jgi:hypothetical protein
MRATELVDFVQACVALRLYTRVAISRRNCSPEDAKRDRALYGNSSCRSPGVEAGIPASRRKVSPRKN